MHGSFTRVASFCFFKSCCSQFIKVSGRVSCTGYYIHFIGHLYFYEIFSQLIKCFAWSHFVCIFKRSSVSFIVCSQFTIFICVVVVSFFHLTILNSNFNVRNPVTNVFAIITRLIRTVYIFAFLCDSSLVTISICSFIGPIICFFIPATRG
ncbi:hypothetical protein D3C73_1144090 [compost metagenome]